MSVKSLSRWLAYLEQLHPSEIELGLERIRKVAADMQVLQPAPLVITVTGTNGKGSTCAFLARLLAIHGLRVGVYSSPHFLRYNERIRIDGQQASDDDICQAFARVEATRRDTSLTYFEFGTLAALDIFTRAGIDVAILEVGLGGRLDAVNLVEPDIAVITTIARDHDDWLGSSREDVAREKAGIMRPGKPVVCGDVCPPDNFMALVHSHQARAYLRGREFDLQTTASHWNWQGSKDGQQLRLEHLSNIQLPAENAAVALQVMALLDLPMDLEQINQALSDTTLTGRMQSVRFGYNGKDCRLLLDVAHNPQAAQYLATRLKSHVGRGRLLAVFGALNDKDVAGVLGALEPLVDHWALAPLPSPRSCNPQQLVQTFEQGRANYSLCANIAQALELQLDKEAPDDEILVFGSFFTVTQALEYMGLSG